MKIQKRRLIRIYYWFLTETPISNNWCVQIQSYKRSFQKIRGKRVKRNWRSLRQNCFSPFRNGVYSQKKDLNPCRSKTGKPFPDPKRKRKPTNLNKHKPNKCTKSTKISSLFPKRGNRNTKRTEKHKNKMTHGKTYNKSPRRINHKATKSLSLKSRFVYSMQTGHHKSCHPLTKIAENLPSVSMHLNGNGYTFVRGSSVQCLPLFWKKWSTIKGKKSPWEPVLYFYNRTF